MSPKQLRNWRLLRLMILCILTWTSRRNRRYFAKRMQNQLIRKIGHWRWLRPTSKNRAEGSMKIRKYQKLTIASWASWRLTSTTERISSKNWRRNTLWSYRTSISPRLRPSVKAGPFLKNQTHPKLSLCGRTTASQWRRNKQQRAKHPLFKRKFEGSTSSIQYSNAAKTLWRSLIPPWLTLCMSITSSLKLPHSATRSPYPQSRKSSSSSPNSRRSPILSRPSRNLPPKISCPPHHRQPTTPSSPI